MKNIKLIIAVLILFILCNSANAQDVIYKKDGTKVKAIIEEITPVEISYKKYERPDGPIYKILKISVLLIEFEDGTIEVFNQVSETGANDEVDYEVANNLYAEKLKRNILSINYLHIINGNVHLGYERITKSGIAGLKLSVNYNIDDVDSDILAYNRDFTTGIDINLYPTGQGKIKYFLGPSFRVGVVSTDYDYVNNRYIQRQTEFNYFGIFFNNGFNLQATPKLALGFQGALGIGRFSRRDGRYTNTELDGIIAFNMGYRF